MPDNPHLTCEPIAITKIVLNGQPFDLPTDSTVASLVELRQPRPPFAVELNKRLVSRSAYKSTLLNQGDILEIVTLVGGG